jgi:Protein of unknown function (DUF3892)
MATVRIDCVNKPDRLSPHESITRVGGPQPSGNGRWKSPTAEVVRMIESKQHTFYTRENGRTASVGVRVSARGHKFLQTYADGVLER